MILLRRVRSRFSLRLRSRSIIRRGRLLFRIIGGFKLRVGNYPISVLDYKQMAGQAGQVQSTRLVSLFFRLRVADEADYLMEGYVLAKPERIWSRLAVEHCVGMCWRRLHQFAF